MVAKRIVGQSLVYLLVAFSFGSFSQASTAQAGQQARRDQLAAASECLADPDPNKRIACMEEILASRDLVQIQNGLRIAFRGEDPTLKALAFRSYLASTAELSFTTQLPPTIEAQYQSTLDDPERAGDFGKKFPWIGFYAQLGGQVHFTISNYKADTGRGMATTDYNRAFKVDRDMATAPFTVSGDRVTSTLTLYGRQCALEFRPGTDLQLRGTLLCNGGGGRRGPDEGSPMPRILVTSPLF